MFFSVAIVNRLRGGKNPHSFISFSQVYRFGHSDGLALDDVFEVEAYDKIQIVNRSHGYVNPVHDVFLRDYAFRDIESRQAFRLGVQRQDEYGMLVTFDVLIAVLYLNPGGAVNSLLQPVKT